MKNEDEHKCTKCKKEVKDLWQYKPYEGDKHPWLCEKCFKKYEKSQEKLNIK